MPPAHQFSPAAPAAARPAASRATWVWSLPLLLGVFSYLYFITRAATLLRDGDTYWHIAAGRWILEHRLVPDRDPFSHSMAGSAWTAQEWLSQVLLALAHQAGGWMGVTAVIALSFAVTVALLARALLRWLEPIYVLMFSALAVCMAAGHVFARPHVLAMPLLMIWSIELVRASEDQRTPRLWMLPLMTVWANMHGGFTLGIALACAFALEAALAGWQAGRGVAAAKSWAIFLALAVGSALVTPHGTQGILFTWQVLFEDNYALQRIGEWQSPDFHSLQPLELWLLGGLALVLHQGLRLPPVRLLVLLGLMHLSLKHMRSIELLGLLGPLVVAAPFGAQWRARQRGKKQLESADRFLAALSKPAGTGPVLVCAALLVAATAWSTGARTIELPAEVAPEKALEAVRHEGIKGPVLNAYGMGGYLIFSGIPVFIDGRSDMYRDAFLKQYGDAIELRRPEALEQVLRKYQITWTLLDAGMPAAAMLDRLPGWRRLYADRTAVVHVKTGH